MSCPLLPPIRPSAWLDWYKEHTSLVPRSPDDKKHALLVVGSVAVKKLAHNAFLPTNLNLQTAKVQFFSTLSLDKIHEDTQLAVFTDCVLEEVAKQSKVIERLLQNVALIFYCPEGDRQLAARVGVNDSRICPFMTTTSQDFVVDVEASMQRIQALSKLF